MRLRALFAAMLLLSVCASLVVSVVYADPWAAIKESGYAITVVFPPHGEVVPIGVNVRVRAGTTHYNDEDVHAVTFRWMPPAGSGLSDIFHRYVPLAASNPPEYTPNGEFIYDAFDTLTISALGSWGVQAWFHDSRGRIMARTDIIAIRATSFTSVPEAPFGTVAVLVSMFGALGVLAVKRKRIRGF